MAATWRCDACGHLVKHAARSCTNCRAERVVDGGDIASAQDPESAPARRRKRAPLTQSEAE